MIKINNVRIFLNSNSSARTKATATVLINKKLLLQSVRIVELSDEATGEPILRVYYPNQRLSDGRYRRYVSVSEDFRNELDSAILDAYEQVAAGASDNTVIFSDDEGDFEITNANVFPIPSEGETPNPLLAKVGIQLDEKLWLRGMILVRLSDGTRILRSPNRRTGDDRRINYFQFIDTSTRDAFRNHVLDIYDELPADEGAEE